MLNYLIFTVSLFAAGILTTLSVLGHGFYYAILGVLIFLTGWFYLDKEAKR